MAIGTATALALGVGGTLIGSKMSSDATKKAAQTQANSIKDAQGISAAAAAQARRDALALFDPAFESVFDAAQGARDELMAGRANTYEILNRTNQSVGNILQQGSKNYTNAILGAGSSTPSKTMDDIYRTPGIRPERATKPMVTSSLRATDSGISMPTGVGRGGFSPDDVRKLVGGGSPMINQPGFYNPSGAQTANTPTQSGTQANAQSLSPLDIEPIDVYQNELGVYEAAPNTGLRGATETIQQGAGDAISALRQGAGGAIGAQQGSLQDQLNLISSGVGSGISAINQGAMTARGDISSGLNTGLNALYEGANIARGDIASALRAGSSALTGAINKGRGDVTSGVNKAASYLAPYRETGESALQREAALSGALGAQAQADAYASFQESPGQKYLREQSERALTRNSAALGDVGGGNVMRELQAQAQGLALQDLDRQTSNLRSLATRGQDASNQSGAYQMQGAGLLSQLQSQLGQGLMNANMNAGSNLANISQLTGNAALNANVGAGRDLSGIAQNQAGNVANLGMQGALSGSSSVQGAGNNISNILSNQGINEAGVIGGATSALSGMQMNAGQSIANNQQALASALGQLESNMGTSLANADQQTINNAINIMLSQGGTQAQLATQLATLLGNVATGQGTQQANLATALGQANASGVTNPWGNAISQLTGLAASGAFSGNSAGLP